MVRKILSNLIIGIIFISVITGCSKTEPHNYTITYEAQTSSPDEKTMDNAKDIIKDRFKAMDCKNIEVTREGEKGLKIVLSSDGQAKTLAEFAGKRNEFKIIGPDDSIMITSQDIRDSASQQNPKTKEYLVFIKFTEEGKSKFTIATAKYIGKYIKICLDDEVITAPIVQAPITNGEAVITGSKDEQEAKQLASVIKLKNPLPFSFNVISVSENQ